MPGRDVGSGGGMTWSELWPQIGSASTQSLPKYSASERDLYLERKLFPSTGESDILQSIVKQKIISGKLYA